MLLYKDEAEKLIKVFHTSTLNELKGVRELLDSLENEDDWSFVIKVQMLIEATITELIVTSIGENNFQPVMIRLPLLDEEYGKLKITKDLDLTSPEERNFIAKMASLRNILAHNISFITFSFNQYFGELDEGKLKSFRSAVCWFAKDMALKKQWTHIFQKSPKTVIWVSVFLLVVNMLTTMKGIKSRKGINDLGKTTTSQLLEDVL